MDSKPQVPTHLRIGDRKPDQDFTNEERLLCAAEAAIELPSGEHIVPEDQIDYPGSDGMSFSRDKYCKCGDLQLLFSRPDWGEAWLTCGVARQLYLESDLPEKSKKCKFSLEPLHDPEPGNRTKNALENYAHTILQTMAEGEFIKGKRIRKAAWGLPVIEYFRSELSKRLRFERLPKDVRKAA